MLRTELAAANSQGKVKGLAAANLQGKVKGLAAAKLLEEVKGLGVASLVGEVRELRVASLETERRAARSETGSRAASWARWLGVRWRVARSPAVWAILVEAV
jgi:hypothetical protein